MDKKKKRICANRNACCNTTVLQTNAQELLHSFGLAKKRTSGGGMIILPWTPPFSLLPSLIL